MQLAVADHRASGAAAEPDAGWVQGLLLAAIPAVLVMTVVVVIPIIPRLLVVFAREPNKSVLVPMLVVLPTLALALSSIGAGMLGERIGRRRLLDIAAAVFAVTAILPFWLNSFVLILLTRAACGVALGAMVTSGVGLTGDYFSGVTRQKWLAIQGGVSAGSGVVTSAVAGVLGDISWRLPFLLLSVGFLLFLALILLPAKRAAAASGGVQGEGPAPETARPVPWRVIAAIVALGVFGSLLIFPPAYELGVVFQEKRMGAATLTGLATAALALGAVGGASGLRLLRALSAPQRMAVAFALGGVGTLLIAMGSQIAIIVVGAVAVGIGQGMTGPVLSIWLLDRTPAAARGRIVGSYTTVFFFAQFAAPLVAGWVAAQSGGMISSMVYYELASALAVALTLILSIRASGAVTRDLRRA